jgi:hypothetical protein
LASFPACSRAFAANLAHARRHASRIAGVDGPATTFSFIVIAVLADSRVFLGVSILYLHALGMNWEDT